MNRFPPIHARSCLGVRRSHVGPGVDTVSEPTDPNPRNLYSTSEQRQVRRQSFSPSNPPCQEYWRMARDSYITNVALTAKLDQLALARFPHCPAGGHPGHIVDVCRRRLKLNTLRRSKSEHSCACLRGGGRFRFDLESTSVRRPERDRGCTTCMTGPRYTGWRHVEG
jgi:hypothetical protein